MRSVETVRMQALDYMHRDIAPLNVGLEPSISPTPITDALSRVADVVPGLQVELIRESGTRLVEMLFDGVVNAALVHNLDVVPDRIDRWRLFEQRYVILAMPSHPLAEQPTLRYDAMRDAVWLERAGGNLTNQLWRSCFSDGSKPKIAHRGSEETHLQYMAAAGFGVMLAPEHAPHLSSLVAIPVGEELLRHQVELLVVAGRRYSPALDALVKIARARDAQCRSATTLVREGSGLAAAQHERAGESGKEARLILSDRRSPSP